jgi:cobalt-precorrin-6B (C15)-methyltransferase
MWTFRTPGIPDELFSQSEAVPGPTKEEIRVITISKARLREGSVVFDVGCGTGGLTVEAALQVGSKGKVYAIDKNPEAVKFTKINVEKFNLQETVSVKQGIAPDLLTELPSADSVLLGGSRYLPQVLEITFEKLKSGGRVVVNAILIETAFTAIEVMKKLGFQNIDVVEVAISKAKTVPSGTMMISRNPIKIISATKP